MTVKIPREAIDRFMELGIRSAEVDSMPWDAKAGFFLGSMVMINWTRADGKKCMAFVWPGRLPKHLHKIRGDKLDILNLNT